jgi:hypothetical protein
VDQYFVPVRLTVLERDEKSSLNTPGGAEVMARLGGSEAGLPFFALLDAKGGAIVSSLHTVPGKPKPVNIGHPIEPEEVDWFLVMVGKAAPAISPDEVKVLETWLRNQKK